MLTVMLYTMWFDFPLVMAIALAFQLVMGDIIFRGAEVVVRKAVNSGRDSLIKAGRVVRRGVADRSLVLPCEVTVRPGRICQ